MILTPTYHVFEMFKGHQDSVRLLLLLQSQDYAFNGEAIPQVSVSASRNRQGEILVTACNLNPDQPAELLCSLYGTKPTKVAGRVLTAKSMNAFNTFASPETVRPVQFDGATLDGNNLKIRLPAMSVVALTF